jgi:hypothetical protein
MAIDSDGELYDSDEVNDYDKYREDRDRERPDQPDYDADEQYRYVIEYVQKGIRKRDVSSWSSSYKDVNRDRNLILRSLKHDKVKAYTSTIDQLVSDEGDIKIVEGSIKSKGNMSVRN